MREVFPAARQRRKNHSGLEVLKEKFMNEIKMEIKRLSDKYAPFGVLESDIRRMLDSRLEELDEKSALLILRMELASEFGQKEFCTLEEASHLTGMPVDSLKKRLQDLGVSTYNMKPAPYLEEYLKKKREKGQN